MKNPVFILSSILMLACGPAGAAELSLAAKLDLLLKSYPDSLSSVEGGKLHFRDGGAPLLVDDGRAKSHSQALKGADIEDMLAQIYPMGPCQTRPAVNFDPGRVRVDAFFRRLYGNSKKAVRSRLVRVKWFGKTLMVHPGHGAAAGLKRVQAEIAALPARLRKPARKSAGTFN